MSKTSKIYQLMTTNFIFSTLNETSLRKNTKNEDFKMGQVGLKNISKKIEDLEKEIVEKRKLNTERKADKNRIEMNILDINSKKEGLAKEIFEFNDKKGKFQNSLNNFINEESMQKKLTFAYSDVMKNLMAVQAKDYAAEVF